jgi:MYXO-CTERM domain-containing protein
MNRSRFQLKGTAALGSIAITMLMASHAAASEGEHTDWPDYPEGLLRADHNPPAPRPRLRLPNPAKRPVAANDPGEHTDWPDYPEGDPSSFLNKIGLPPTDPNAWPTLPIPGHIPNLDDLLNPFPPASGFDGFGNNSPDLGLNSTSAVPAPGSALLMLGLAAAATRRRRR